MHMLDRRHRLVARFLAIGLLTATLYTVDSLALPSPAEARCMGQGNPVHSWFAYGGGKAASETPGHGTCNGNDIYSGVLKDERADGLCPSVWFNDAGQGWFQAPGGYVCGYGNTSSFQWNDRNNNSTVYERLCLENEDTFVCGWGSVRGDYATNWGF
jgi:hypothetical protein